MEQEKVAEFRSHSALVVSGSEKGADYFAELMAERFTLITRAASAADAMRHLAQTPFDVIVINAPLTDEYGDRLAVYCAENTYAGVLLLVKEENAAALSAAEEAGALLLKKPAGKGALLSAVRLTAAVGRRLFAARSKARTLESKMDEMKVVNRAKWLLIDKLGMAETDAHRYIEKLAMDTRETRREVAEGIIKTYET